MEDGLKKLQEARVFFWQEVQKAEGRKEWQLAETYRWHVTALDSLIARTEQYVNARK